MSKAIVFGGWALGPEILKPVFGESASYIDVNHLVSALFNCETLVENWPEKVISILQLTDKVDCLVGWSTGAMFAFALARKMNVDRLILLSATPSFCRNGTFKFGTRPSVLDQMIRNIDSDPVPTLSSFIERCGLDPQKIDFDRYSSEQLKKGLKFLKQADLHPLAPLPLKPLFLHGREDEIIPWDASVYFSRETGGVHHELAGSHTFFLQHRSEVCRYIDETYRYMDNVT